MEQLIVCQADDGRYAVRPVSWAGIWDKSGLLASECKSIAYFDDEQDAKDYIAYRALGPVEELTALVKARDEGRVVVLDMPRKPLVWGDDDHNTCLCPDCGEDLMGIPYGERMVLQCPACGRYLDATKVITRAEAEAALGGGGDG